MLPYPPMGVLGGSQGSRDCPGPLPNTPRHAKRALKIAKTAPRGPGDAEDGLRTADDAAKTPQEGLKRLPQRAPEAKNQAFAVGFRMIFAFSHVPLPHGPGRRERPFKSLQDGRRGSQEGPETAQEAPQTTQEGPKNTPRGGPEGEHEPTFRGLRP